MLTFAICICTNRNCVTTRYTLWLFFSWQDPTNGYYNVRASTHDEGRPASRSMHYSDYRTSTAPGASAAVGGSSGTGATAGPGTPSSLAPGSRAGCYDPRPPSRLSYAQFNTFSRPSQSQQPPPSSGPQTGDFPAECSLLDSPPQLPYENYSYPSHYPTYRLGFAPPSLAPLESGAAYEMYSVGPSVSVGGTAATPDSGLGKYGSSTRFSYTSQHSDYSHRHTQRMQTHVWRRSEMSHCAALLHFIRHTWPQTQTYTGGSCKESENERWESDQKAQ